MLYQSHLNLPYMYVNCLFRKIIYTYASLTLNHLFMRNVSLSVIHEAEDICQSYTESFVWKSYTRAGCLKRSNNIISHIVSCMFKKIPVSNVHHTLESLIYKKICASLAQIHLFMEHIYVCVSCIIADASHDTQVLLLDPILFTQFVYKFKFVNLPPICLVCCS